MNELKRVTSRYKLFGGFGLLIILNGMIGVPTYLVLTRINYAELMSDSSTQIAFAFMFGLQLLFLTLFATQNRYIIVDVDGIAFINPLLPFLRSKYRWTYFDFYVTVEESSEYTTHSAIWLVKDDKLKARISSFYYSNFAELVQQVRAESKGERSYSPFAQLFIAMRLMKVGKK